MLCDRGSDGYASVRASVFGASWNASWRRVFYPKYFFSVGHVRDDLREQPPGDLHALVALRRDNANATEAAMKYFVLGAMASGFLLYGMSMLYGATGSLDITTIFKAISSGQVRHQVLVFGLVFIVSGLAFKIGAVPFHMWIPDVYQGAPTAITLMIGGAPKLAAFAMIMRLLVEGLLRLAANAFDALGGLIVCRQSGGNCPNECQADAGVFHYFTDGFCAAGHFVGCCQW